MRKKANYWIEKNQLNIIPKDPEYKIHIKSIDAFLEGDYKKSYALAKCANKSSKRHDVLRLPRL